MQHIPPSYPNSHIVYNSHMASMNHLSHFSPISIPTGFSYPMNFAPRNVPVYTSSSIHPGHRSNPSQMDIYNSLVMWKLRNEYQSQLFNSQMIQLMESSKNTGSYGVENVASFDKKPQQTSSKQLEASPNQYLPELCDSNKSMKAHLKDIIYFVLGNFGSLSEEEINVEKLKYRNNKDLLMVFEALVSKYTSAVKTREEMVKYAFRKAVKYMKLKVKKEMKKGMAMDSSNPDKRNFNLFLEEMSGKIEDDVETEEKDHSTKKILPFSQGAKNSHLSTEVMNEAFSSRDFVVGFQEYLHSFDGTLELDNNKKIDKFIKFIEGSMKKNSIRDIKKFKRIPWLKSWIDSTKRIAYDLVYTHSNASYDARKIIKKEEYISGSDSYSNGSFSAKIEEAST